MNGRLLVALSVAVLTIGVSSPAHAQSKAAARRDRDAQVQQAGQQQAQRRQAPRKVLRLEEMRVEGRVQKPQALFLMPRASVASGEQDRTESFVGKAKDAVKQEPF